MEQHLKGELRLDKTLHGLADIAGRLGKATRRSQVPQGSFGRLLG